MEPGGSQRGEVWKIKPYPRKGDEFCLSHITELTVKSSKVAVECTRRRQGASLQRRHRQTHAYMEFTIDASKSPHGVTMVDFNGFMCAAYSLPKETAVALGKSPKVKPRLLIIKRHRTRMFLNLEEIIAMAEEL
ncbi:hypothetical protein ZWY2020_036751 [Hordeum vulgare]|nr:hypothetical protein ZWY2020_036751 [Hordeum vulgare]